MLVLVVPTQLRWKLERIAYFPSTHSKIPAMIRPKPPMNNIAPTSVGAAAVVVPGKHDPRLVLKRNEESPGIENSGGDSPAHPMR